MKKRPVAWRVPTALAVLVTLSAGCASVAVSDDAIVQSTAQALGLAQGSFVIGQRVDQGRTASYRVMTNTGKQYDCQVRAVLSGSVAGRSVSEPICTETGKVSKPAADATTPASAGA